MIEVNFNDDIPGGKCCFAILIDLSEDMKLNTENNYKFLKEIKMKRTLIKLVLFAIFFPGAQLFAVDNRAYYIGDQIGEG